MRLLAKAILPAVGFIAATGNVAADEGIDFFEKKIRPVLIEHCYKCHSAEAEQRANSRASYGSTSARQSAGVANPG